VLSHLGSEETRNGALLLRGGQVRLAAAKSGISVPGHDTKFDLSRTDQEIVVFVLRDCRSGEGKVFVIATAVELLVSRTRRGGVGY